MKKVLFAIPTLGGGGAERVLVTLLNNLDKDKYDITLFSMFDGGINKRYLNENIHYRYYFKKSFRGNIHFLKLFTPESLYRKMIKEDYDIVISYLEGSMTRVISGCLNKNTKIINWVHIEINDPKVLLQTYRNKHELEKSYSKYDATVFVSDTARTAFQKTFKNISGNMLVKYNSVDTDLIKSKSIERVDDIKFESKKVNLISVGRFTEQKGYIRLLEIINMLIRNDKLNIHLYLLGKGELENKYRSVIEKYGLNKHVTILGYKDNPYQYVRNSDLFVCSSYCEGYSTAVTESLIVGTPVVTTLCSGMEEMLGHNNEYGLITKNSKEDLYKGMKRILTESGLLKHYKEKAEERGRSFSTEKTVEEIEHLLDNC